MGLNNFLNEYAGILFFMTSTMIQIVLFL